MHLMMKLSTFPRLLAAAAFAMVTLFSVSLNSASAAESLEVGEFKFKTIEPWKAKSTPRMMSQGGYQVLSSDGKTMMDADFYHFGSGQGGDLEANVARWKGQFKPGDDGTPVKMERKEYTFGKRKMLLVTLKGTFLSGSAMGPKTPVPGSAMLGAILESEEGTVFIKFTGPEKDVESNREGFLKLIGTAYTEAAKEVVADEKAK
jgi:hypothetical protein